MAGCSLQFAAPPRACGDDGLGARQAALAPHSMRTTIQPRRLPLHRPVARRRARHSWPTSNPACASHGAQPPIDAGADGIALPHGGALTPGLAVALTPVFGARCTF